jgi:hypothetical protein
MLVRIGSVTWEAAWRAPELAAASLREAFNSTLESVIPPSLGFGTGKMPEGRERVKSDVVPFARASDAGGLVSVEG